MRKCLSCKGAKTYIATISFSACVQTFAGVLSNAKLQEAFWETKYDATKGLKHAMNVRFTPITNAIMAEKTLFERIIDREIPATIVHEDAHCVAFRDVAPKSPTHILIVPRKPIISLAHLEPEDAPIIGHLFLVAKQLAEQEGLTNGYRTVFNCGADAGQTVFHLHLHLMGGRDFAWPPG